MGETEDWLLGVFVRLGAVWLAVAGVALLARGLRLAGRVLSGAVRDAWSRAHGGPADYGLGAGVFVIALLRVAVAGAHFAAALGMWDGLTWGRWLGAIVAMTGLVFTVYVWLVGRASDADVGLWNRPKRVDVAAYGYGLTYPVTLAAAIVWYPTNPA